MVTYQVYTVDRGGGRTPTLLNVIRGNIGSRTEAEAIAEERTREFRGISGISVGVRETPEIQPPSKFEYEGREFSGEFVAPAPKGRPTTRTQEEQAEVEAKYRELTATNIGATYGEEAKERYLQRTEPKEVTTVMTTAEFERLKEAEVKARVLETTKKQEFISRVRGTLEKQRIAAVKPIITVSPAIITPPKFEKTGLQLWAKGIEQRQQDFFGSEGFKRIEDVARVITRQDEGVAKRVVTSLLSWPIGLGGTIPMVAEKIAFVGYGLATGEVTPKAFKEESIRTLPYIAEVYKDPATYITTGIFAVPIAAGGIAVPRVKFEAGIKETVAKVTEKGKEFDTTTTFIPKKTVLEIDIKGKVTKVVEVEPQQAGFLVFDESGAIVGRQKQLVPKDVPYYEAQAGFKKPSLAVERVVKDVDQYLGKFVERPLTPTEIIKVKDPAIATKGYTMVKPEPLQLKFKRLFPPSKKGQATLIPEIDLAKAETFTGEFFTRIKSKIPTEPLEVISKAIPKPKASTILATGITAGVLATGITAGKLAIKPISVQDSSLFQDISPIQEPILDIGQKPAVTPTQEQIPISSLVIGAESVVEPIQEPTPILETTTTLEPPPPREITPKKPPRTTPRIPTTFILGLPKAKAGLLAAAITKEKGYDVLIKKRQLKKGKKYKTRGYEKANKVPLSRTAALGLGASIVDTYTNRSYKIVKTNKIAIKRAELEQKWRLLKTKFRQNKTNPNVITEKTKYAIDSIEEKEGIPFKAARLRKLGLLQTNRRNKAIINKIKYNSFLTKKRRKGGTKWF